MQQPITRNTKQKNSHLISFKIKKMAILVSSKVAGQTKEGYDGVLTAVRESIKKAPGFIMQCAHPAEGGWYVTEIWESKKDADRWFAEYIVPNIPPGVHPKRSYQELYNVITPFE
jgi:hypothetical protein